MGEPAHVVPYPDCPEVQQAVYRTLLDGEKTNPLVSGAARLPVGGTEEYVAARRMLVDWVSDVAEEFRLLVPTTHLAIRYMDIFLLLTPFPRSRLQLAATTAVLLAAKFEENEGRVPPIRALVKATNFAYSREDIVAIEAYMLRRIDWRLNQVTAHHFIRYFTALRLVDGDDCVDGAQACTVHLSYVEKYVSFFLELVLLEPEFAVRWYPSHVAAAIVSCARRAVRVDPIWSQRLHMFTGYAAEDIYGCYKAINELYTRHFPPHDAAPAAAAASAAAAAAAAAVPATPGYRPSPQNVGEYRPEPARPEPAALSFAEASAVSKGEGSSEVSGRPQHRVPFGRIQQ